jgi:uncharacterized protein YbjT (DUF2867 family)
LAIERVCVLGGSGFIGRSLCDRLGKRGVDLRVPTRSRSGVPALLVLPTIEVLTVNALDDRTLARAFAGMDAVVNLTGILHARGSEGFEAVHVDLARRVARACGAAGVPRLIQMSALRADPEAPSEYLRSRGRGEIAAREAAQGVGLTIFRPSVVFGRDDRFLNTFATLMRFSPVVPLGCADARFQPIWVEDVARAIDVALDLPGTHGATYELGGPHVRTLAELVAFVARCMGRSRFIVPLPDPVAWLQALTLEFLPGPLLTRDNLRSMSVPSVCTGPFPEFLGFAPAALEAIAPGYLAGRGLQTRYDAHRYRAGR